MQNSDVCSSLGKIDLQRTSFTDNWAIRTSEISVSKLAEKLSYCKIFLSAVTQVRKEIEVHVQAYPAPDFAWQITVEFDYAEI